MADPKPLPLQAATGARFGKFATEGYPVYSPDTLYDYAIEQRLPLEPWFGRCNLFTNPLGYGPGKGMLLIRRGDLDEIVKNEFSDLAFYCGGDTVVIKNVVVIDPVRCVTPGADDEKNSLYAVTIADRRYQMARKQLGRRYNMLKPPPPVPSSSTSSSSGSSSGSSGSSGTNASCYEADSLNGDQAWTWQAMLADIWNTIRPDNSTLTLSPAPDGVPEQFNFERDNALYALCVVLDRLGRALRWTPWTDRYDVVTIGNDPTQSDEKVESYAWFDVRLWDDYAVAVPPTGVPDAVSVQFRVYPSVCGYPRVCTVDVPRLNAPAGERRSAGTRRVIPDDLFAKPEGVCGASFGSSSGSGSGSECPTCSGASGASGLSGCGTCGSYANRDALYARACERATDFYRLLTKGADVFHRETSGLYQVKCSGRVKAVAWGDRGGPTGMRTSFYRGPDILPPLGLWEQYAMRGNDPPWCGAGGPGIIVSFVDDVCFYPVTSSGSGSGSGVPPA